MSGWIVMSKHILLVMIIIGAEQQLCLSSCTMHVCVVKVAYVAAQ